MVDTDGVCRVTVGSTGGADVLAAAREAGARATEVGPTGADALEPLAITTRNGRTAFHANATPDAVRYLATALVDGTVPVGGAHAVVEHDPNPVERPRPEGGPLGTGVRRITATCGWADPVDPTTVAEGVSDDLVTVRDRARDSGFRGRGRGDAATDEPVVGRWETALRADGDPVVVVNANEADERVAGDRLLAESATARVLDAALCVAGIVEATDVVVYVGTDDAIARARFEALATAVRERELADASVDVVAGPALYRAGEQTMALEAMEGNDRIEARRRPPGPATYGLFGRPTVVHTPRTHAGLRRLVRDGVDGAPGDPGTRLVTVSGDVDAPATVELPTGAPLRTALDAVEAPVFRMACVGGQFGGLTRSLDLPLTADALHAAVLGTNGAVELFAEGRCPVAAAGHRARFAREENCGRCVPCREGSKQLHELLRAVYDGRYPGEELRELVRTMRSTSMCEFGVAAARPVVTALEEFEGEVRAHADGRCPAGECEMA